MPNYSAVEMIAFTGSRMLEDNKIVFVGTGLPMIAAMHAQLTHAPGLGMIFEAGALSPVLDMGGATVVCWRYRCLSAGLLSKGFMCCI